MAGGDPYLDLMQKSTFWVGGICCTRPVDNPHPWMVAVTGGSRYPSRGGKFTGRMKNSRVGWANDIEKGDEGYWKGGNKRLESLNYAERDRWIKSTDRVPIHGACPPIHGRGENSTSRVQQIQHLRVNQVFVFCLFVRWKYILFPFSFFVFLILMFFFFLPPSMDGAYPTREFFILR